MVAGTLGGRAALARAAHGGAAADRALARVRRPRRGPRRHREVLDLARRGRAHRVPHDRDRGRGAARLPHLHRQPDGRRQAPGGDPDPPDHLPRPERRELRAARASRCCAASRVVLDPTQWPLFARDHRAVAAVRRAADHPDRRRRHAHRDLAAQLLRGPRGGGDGLRAREPAPDHRGRARRRLGLHPVHDHVPRDEPLVHERAVRRVRAGAGAGGGRRGEAGQERHAAGRRRLPRERAARGVRARLRHGRGAGAAPRARDLRRAARSAGSR